MKVIVAVLLAALVLLAAILLSFGTSQMTYSEVVFTSIVGTLAGVLLFLLYLSERRSGR